jgi:dipeptidyl aminopeptidase/acylaminoacyl peptidase
MNKQLIISIVILACLIIATVLVVLYGKGYRFGIEPGKIEFNGTGLLVTKSIPDGAQVFINGKLKTATDNTINLAPGDYSVKISKEGYFPWEKQIKIHAEVVSRAEALLIPSAPKLESITDVGATTPTIDPTLTKIAFVVASQSSKRNGIYVFDMKSNPLLTLQSSSTQIVDDSYDLFSQSQISWSPDGKDLIATVSANNISNTYLLDTDQPNTPPNNVTETLPTVDGSWTKLKKAKDRAVLDSLPPKVRKMAATDFNVLAYSPDHNKILYSASRSASLPVIIKPRLIGVNSTPEQRDIKTGGIYVYDTKEDRNYQMDSGNFQGAYSWFTDSKHLILVRNKELHMIEFDGLNDTTVYAGPFIDNYVFPWPDATRIVVLTNLGNNKILPNLYTISLK